MKLPSLQFYPGDWRKDPGIQSLNYFDRGVWHEILLIMHESEQRGKLILNGKAMPIEALARLLGLDKQILNDTLKTLENYGVTSIDEMTGALVNRRMVRDEENRKKLIEYGKLGGNPNLIKKIQKEQLNPNLNPMVKPKPTSSSSSSANIKNILNCKDVVAEKNSNSPFQKVVNHMLSSFELKKGAKYPFSAIDGKIVKSLIALYSDSQIMALWDVFLNLDTDWIRKVGHKITEFQRQIPMLLDKTDWKIKAKEYDGKNVVNVPLNIIPLKINEQNVKVESLKKLKLINMADTK